MGILYKDYKYMKNKFIIISAPSGSGKTSIIKGLLLKIPNIELAISMTTRPPRTGEESGRDYYFIEKAEFEKMIEQDQFLEWEEVYKGTYYGTPKSEVERISQMGKVPLLEIDVRGGQRIKGLYKEHCLSIFVKPPSIEELERRLRGRGTESEESLQKRLAKVKKELSYEKFYDRVVVNDSLDQAVEETANIILEFIKL